MARERHREKNSSKNPRKTHVEKLRELSRRGIQVDPTNPRSVSRQYYQKVKVPRDLERPAPKARRAELKAHGFFTTPKGVVVDGPRDRRRKPIKGARVEILKGGVIKTSVGQRRDFIYGFTKSEKKEFAADPAAFEKKKLRELLDKFPSLRKSRKRQVRLQWGAYQATKNFTSSYFTAKYFAATSPEEIRRVGKRRAQPRADKLTGLHIVVHVPSNARNRNGVKKNDKSKRRKKK